MRVARCSPIIVLRICKCDSVAMLILVLSIYVSIGFSFAVLRLALPIDMNFSYSLWEGMRISFSVVAMSWHMSFALFSYISYATLIGRP